MADENVRTVTVVDDVVRVETTVVDEVPADEALARIEFWTDELARIEAEYPQRKADAERHLAELGVIRDKVDAFRAANSVVVEEPVIRK